MKIKLKSIHLINFMTYHDKTFEFGDTTKISGKNGVGKSSICTAYSWLMFDTDMDLHSNPKIRQEIDGQPINDMDTAVEAVFDIDGKEVTTRKVQKRTFSKDKTSYKDDNTYFINEVPKTLKAFNEYFGVDMKLLQMCSNINAFLSKKDKDMREYLFLKVEDITDLDIAKKYSELSELVPLLEQYTAEEVEKMNKASKAKIDKEIPVLNGQIKEKERDVTDNVNINVKELVVSRDVLRKNIADIKARQTDISKQYKEYQELSDDILKLKRELSDLERKANEENEKKKREIDGKNIDFLNEINDLEGKIRTDKVYISSSSHNCETFKNQIERYREEWKRTNALEFDESSLNCLYCGQKLPSDKETELREKFKKQKADDLERITRNGNELNETIKVQEKERAECQKRIEEWEKQLAEVKEKLSANDKERADLPVSIDTSDIEEYKVIQSQLGEKEAAIQKCNSADEIRQSLNAELSEAQEQLIEVEKQIAKADVSADEERLSELKKQRIDLEQGKANTEKIIDLLSELDKKKNESLSESINSLFGIVDWKLYEYNKSGGYKSVCVPMVDKKSILTIESNKGNRILGRLDIINSVQKIENICCPVFIDDIEALDGENITKAVEMLDCQAILLKVTEDSELQIN